MTSPTNELTSNTLFTLGSTQDTSNSEECPPKEKIIQKIESLYGNNVNSDYRIYSCDTTKKTFCILKSVDFIKGENKNVQTALLIPSDLDKKWKKVALLTIFSNKPYSKSTNLKNEIYHIEEFGNSPGHVRYHTKHIAETEDGCIAEIFTDKYENSLDKVVQKHAHLEPKPLISILADLAKGLEKMHSQDCLHGDIKPANMLYKENKGALCDYGFSSKSNEKTESVKKGYYGVPIYTPPELYGNCDFKGDLKAVETYAFGLACLTIYEAWTPDICKGLLSDFFNEKSTNENERQEFSEKLDSFIKEESSNDQFKNYLLTLIDSDPKKRPSMQTVAEMLLQFAKNF